MVNLLLYFWEQNKIPVLKPDKMMKLNTKII